jgi:hypothetical protein
MPFSAMCVFPRRCLRAAWACRLPPLVVCAGGGFAASRQVERFAPATYHPRQQHFARRSGLLTCGKCAVRRMVWRISACYDAGERCWRCVVVWVMASRSPPPAVCAGGGFAAGRDVLLRVRDACCVHVAVARFSPASVALRSMHGLFTCGKLLLAGWRGVAGQPNEEP